MFLIVLCYVILIAYIFSSIVIINTEKCNFINQYFVLFTTLKTRYITIQKFAVSNIFFLSLLCLPSKYYYNLK